MKSDRNQSLRKRNWLCIAYAFPPINRSGTHRTAAFVRGLDRLGWQAVVLTVAPPPHESLDPLLMAEVPASTEVIRVQWTRPFDSLVRQLRACLSVITCSEASSSIPTQARKSGASNQSFARGMAGLLATPDSRVGWIVPAVWRGLGVIRRRRPEMIYSTSPYA